MSNHPNRNAYIANARRFARTAGRKSEKAKAVRAALREYDAGKIDIEALRARLSATQPWQAHGPINP